MTNVLIPRWEDFEALVARANEKLTFFTPYYSAKWVKKTLAAAPEPVDFEFWTRLSLIDWANGFAAPEKLAEFMTKVKEAGRTSQLVRQPKLHAKAYFADSESALVGSSNLTDGGFNENVEIAIQLHGELAADALEKLTFSSTPRSRVFSVDELNAWIEKYRDKIERYRTNNKENKDELEAAQGEMEVETSVAVIEPEQAHLDSFIQWLANNTQYPGANDLVELNEDRIVQRRQGHVKQCFAGVFRFLQLYPSWIQKLTTAITNDNGIIAPSEELVNDWDEHLRNDAEISTDLFSYATLRGILKPNLGGVLESAGGGASGILKRVWPLVAKHLSEESG